MALAANPFTRSVAVRDGVHVRPCGHGGMAGDMGEAGKPIGLLIRDLVHPSAQSRVLKGLPTAKRQSLNRLLPPVGRPWSHAA